ncbi:MAG: NUDIX hydrolase [Pseudomonadales bacterium]|nr:NUDIX hydrolase [Pseudomonadales bacterium]
MFKQKSETDAIIPVRLSATIILLRDTDSGLKVLLMRRNSQLNFCGGFWVFPGGAVDATDSPDGILPEVCDGESLILKNAAVRETQEEAGIDISIDDLIPVSRWVTPEGAQKRFDTWFYIASVSDDRVSVDGSEMTDSLWTSCEEAIQRHRDKDVEFLPPTLISLMGIAAFDCVADVKQHYQAKTPNQYLPKVSFLQEQLIMLYPGDAAYESGDATDTTALHRCIHSPQGWQYKNEIGVVL